MVHIASSWRLSQVEAEDGRVNVMCCVGPFYSNFAVFYVLGRSDILLF
jgi:hypothetical protein